MLFTFNLPTTPKVLYNGNDVLINDGAGNDFISLSGAGVIALVEYNSGDGFDSIVGFGESVSLKIADGTGTYSTVVGGDDVLVTVGEGVITLYGAASLKSLNILGEEPTWSLSGTTATYSTTTETLLTLSNIKSTDGLAVSNEGVVTVPLASLADATADVVLDGEDYSLKLGKSMATPKSTAASYKDNVYTSKGQSAGYFLDDNSISYSAATTKEFTFTGIADGAQVKFVSCSDGEDYSLKLGKGMTASEVKGLLVDNVYTFGTHGVGYTRAEKSITYSAGLTTLLELDGITKKPTEPSNGVMTLKANNFSDNMTIVSNDGDFKISVAKGDYSGKTFMGSDEADTIANAGFDLQISAGAGDDTL